MQEIEEDQWIFDAAGIMYYDCQYYQVGYYLEVNFLLYPMDYSGTFFFCDLSEKDGMENI